MPAAAHAVDDPDTVYMHRALALARSVLYTTTPNPRVGCVIVRDGRVVGEGATQPPGGPHAEVMALRDAAARGESVQGATVYVTLEPCSHFGRTPPCADALVQSRVARVVMALADPNPLVNGKGAARLRAAGIEVRAGVCEEEALELNAGFIARMSRGTPWVWLKMAASIDGRSALHNGASQWITGAAARADGHHWRARSCVVLTGMGTVIKDNPQLNVRDVITPRPPRKAVVDARFEIAEDARLFDGSEVIVFTAHDDPAKRARLADRNVTVVLMPAVVPGKLDLAAVMQWFADAQMNEVHVESGAGLAGALLSAGCIDELLVYLAPVLLGDAAGMVRMPMLEHLDQARRFAFVETSSVGPDLRLRARDMMRWQALRQSVLPLLPG